MNTGWKRHAVGTLGAAGVALGSGRTAEAAGSVPYLTENGVNIGGLLQAGGAIGYVIIALSVAMVALVVEHLLSIRRASLMPRGLAEECQQAIAGGHAQQAVQFCRDRPSLLGFIVAAGIQEAAVGPEAVEKSMEDAAQEQSARLLRKIEYLSVIGTLAPMLGLMGTVWGMILAFGEFSAKANPQVSEFAPAISVALVTTLQGLCVAIPSLAAFAWFRSRIDEFVAEASLQAEQVLLPLRRALRERKAAPREPRTVEATPDRAAPQPVARERKP
jgi:biopolymer transport protein ExbB